MMDDRAEHVQRYWLPPHVLVCPRIEGTVLLDLKQNRYFALSTSDSVTLSHIVPNWPALPDNDSCTHHFGSRKVAEAYAAKLLKSGLLSAAEPTVNAPMGEAIAPLASVGEEISVKATISVNHLSIFVRSYRWARHSVWNRSLHDIRCEVVDMRSAGDSYATAAFDNEAVRLVSVFRILRPYSFTAKDQCLVHSLALLKFLAHYRVYSTWVIGITLRPWSAHSWIQLREQIGRAHV